MRHSLRRRIAWHPLVAGLALTYFLYRVAASGWTPVRACGFSVAAAWFVLSLADLLTRHRFLDWLYGEGDHPSE
jgi:hypothetical protein